MNNENRPEKPVAVAVLLVTLIATIPLAAAQAMPPTPDTPDEVTVEYPACTVSQGLEPDAGPATFALAGQAPDGQRLLVETLPTILGEDCGIESVFSCSEPVVPDAYLYTATGVLCASSSAATTDPCKINFHLGVLEGAQASKCSVPEIVVPPVPERCSILSVPVLCSDGPSRDVCYYAPQTPVWCQDPGELPEECSIVSSTPVLCEDPNEPPGECDAAPGMPVLCDGEAPGACDVVPGAPVLCGGSVPGTCEVVPSTPVLCGGSVPGLCDVSPTAPTCDGPIDTQPCNYIDVPACEGDLPNHCAIIRETCELVIPPIPTLPPGPWNCMPVIVRLEPTDTRSSYVKDDCRIDETDRDPCTYLDMQPWSTNKPLVCNIGAPGIPDYCQAVNAVIRSDDTDGHLPCGLSSPDPCDSVIQPWDTPGKPLVCGIGAPDYERCLPLLTLPQASGPMSRATIFSELLKHQAIKGLAGGELGASLDLELDVLPVLRDAQDNPVQQASAKEFVLHVAHAIDANATSITDVPSDLLVLLALTAAPDGPQTAFHNYGAGGEWLELVRDRYMALSDALATAYEAAEKDENGWPVESFIETTLDERQERGLVGVALYYLTFWDANGRSALDDVILSLGILGYANAMDTGILATSTSSAVTDWDATCTTMQGIYALVLAELEATVELAFSLVLLVQQEVAAFQSLVAGTWYDSIMGANSIVYPVMMDASNEAYIVDPVFNEHLMSVMKGEDIASQTYHGAVLAAYDAQGDAHEAYTLSEDAKTEEATGEWSISLPQFEAAVADVNWQVPLPSGVVQMNDGVFTTGGSLPVFNEEGIVRQVSFLQYALITQDYQEPRYLTEDTEWGTAACAAVWVGIGAFTVASVGAAAAVGGGGAVTGQRWIVAGAAAGAVAAGAQAASWGASTTDKCSEAGAYDEGFYLEIGTYNNFWTHFDWTGEGIILADGLIWIHGDAGLGVDLPVMQPHEYDNLGKTRGYEHGLETAGAAKAAKLEESEAKLPEFRPILGSGGSTITIEFLCQGLGKVFNAPPGSPFTVPIHPDSDVCLVVTLGAAADGIQKGSGYGVIPMTAESIAGTGYVNVNGNQSSIPVTFDLEAEGVNIAAQ